MDDANTELGYWASRDGKLLCAMLKDRERRWYDFAERRGYVDMWLSMLAEYYGIQPSALLGFDASSVGLEGDQGELVRFRVNETRSYIRLAVTSTTKQRPAFEAATTASESVSERQVDVCESVMEAIYRKWYGEMRERDLVERGELFATMWSWLQWDDEGGEVIDKPLVLPNGQETPYMVPQPTPGIVVRVMPPWQMIVDPTIENEEDLAWCIVRERRSRWEMLELYAKREDPDTGEYFYDDELATQIRNAKPTDATGYEAMFGFDDLELTDDDVVVTHFYHKSTRALREGRYLCCVGEAVCFDGPLRGPLPVKRYQPARFVGNGLGYSDSWDLIVLNQMETQLTSDIATNLSAFGRQSVVADKGMEISEEQLANGMHVIRKPVGSESPHSLMLAEVPAGGQWFLGWIDKKLQSVAGQNSVTRGDPSANIKSGTMAALFASIAQDYQHGRQAALDEHREAVANLMLDMIRANAPDTLVLEMAGANQRTSLKEFRAEMLRSIRRVRVKPVPASLRSRAGQIEVANFLKEVPGAIQTPEQAIEIITTGQVTPLYRASRAALERIRWENEQLASGAVSVEDQPGEPDPMTGMPTPPVRFTPDIPVLPTDNPFLHVPEHVAELSSPAALNDQRVRDAMLAHIAWHVRQYHATSPTMAALLKFPPPQAAQGQPTQDVGGGELEPGKITERAADSGIGLPEPAKPPEPTLQ
jgi:hypothetical protein